MFRGVPVKTKANKMKPMTHVLRAKINSYIKNRLDIAPLIDGVAIKGENLGSSVITYMTRVDDDLSNCNFTNARIGLPDNEINLSGSILTNCNFRGAVFQGRTLFRAVKARGANFAEAFLPYAEYQFGDFRNATFCDTVIRIGSRVGKGAKFDKNLFRELARFWGVQVNVEGESVREND